MDEEKKETPKTAPQYVAEGIGCLLQAIAAAVLLWALLGFQDFSINLS